MDRETEIVGLPHSPDLNSLDFAFCTLAQQQVYLQKN